jgi:uncharacterized protein YaaN involved in tellurite resistance
MSATAEMPQVVFPKQDTGSTELVVTPAPRTQTDQGLAALSNESPAQMRKTLSCASLLVGETRTKAEQEAEKLLDEMLANTQVFSVYGMSALKGVNDLIDRLLKEVEPTKVPELIALMQGLNDEVRAIKSRHDISDPTVRQNYEKMRTRGSRIRKFFGRIKTQIEMLMEDVKSLETQLGDVEKDLRGKQYQLMRNVGFYDQLYEENEAEILQLIYTIGVMELIRDLAAKRAESIIVGDTSLGDRNGEQKAKVIELSSNMEIKIAEYKGRLMVAWATSPQVRTMRTLNVGLAERINELVCVTIPTMKATILQWRMLIQSQDANHLANAVADANNEWLQNYSAAGAAVVPAIAEAIQTPTLAPQTIAAMADSISKQADGVIRAFELGEQHRAEMDNAMIEAKTVIDASTDRVNDAIIAEVLKKAHKAEEVIEVTATVVD